MKKWIPKKEFKIIFAPYNQNGTQIWVISKVKKLSSEIVDIAVRLANLDFINYVRICNETIAASSENYPNRPKVPITTVNHDSAIGLQILYCTTYKYINFFDINSPVKGNGSKMVDAVLKDFPKDWQPTVGMDWSDGFWNKMQERHKKFEWVL